MFKFSRIAVGALALAGLCQSAFALDPATSTLIVGTDHEFFLTGATASDGAIKALVKNDMCTVGSYDLYQDVKVGFGPTDTRGGNWFTMTCTLKGVAPVPAALFNSNVVIHKRAKIGSIYGSYPIALNSYVEFMNIANGRGTANCTANAQTVPVANAYDCPVAASPSALRDTPRHAGNADECDYQTAAPANPQPVPAGLDTICRRGTLGTSDVESEMFQANNLTNFTGDNFRKLTALETGAANITRTRAFGQLFGVAVSNEVFTALQTAQGIANGAPLADGSNWPSLTRDTIRGLLMAQYTTWSAAVRGVVLAGTLDDLTICRREQGSGSQAASNQFFENYPCDTAYLPRADTGGVQVGTLFVKENTSSTNAKNCLNDAGSGGANAVVGVPTGAIGVLSYNGNPGGTETWKWIKIDGVQPTFQNAMLGKYDFWYESQIAYNNNALGNTLEIPLAAAIAGELSKPDRITAYAANGIGALTINGWLWDGLNPVTATLNNNAFPSNFTATNPVFAGRRGTSALGGFPTSGSPLSCRAIIQATDAATGANRAQ